MHCTNEVIFFSIISYRYTNFLLLYYLGDSSLSVIFNCKDCSLQFRQIQGLFPPYLHSIGIVPLLEQTVIPIQGLFPVFVHSTGFVPISNLKFLGLFLTIQADIGIVPFISSFHRDCSLVGIQTETNIGIVPSIWQLNRDCSLVVSQSQTDRGIVPTISSLYRGCSLVVSQLL